MASRDWRSKAAPHDPQRASQKRDPSAGLSIDLLKSCGLSEFTFDRKQGAALSFIGLQPRIEKVLDVSIACEVEKLDSSLLVLATVVLAGSFVGLFGTVWGIMTAFRSIAASRNTSLAVVAPGIAEALFTTAIGLFAAIPALTAYNKFQGDVAKKPAQLEGFLRTRFLYFVASN